MHMIKKETTNFVIGGEIVSTSLTGRRACATSYLHEWGVRCWHAFFMPYVLLELSSNSYLNLTSFRFIHRHYA